MDRFKISCEWAGKPAEVQFDIKKIPGETGPCYMVSVDGLFKGYVTKSAGHFISFADGDITEDWLAAIKEHFAAQNK